MIRALFYLLRLALLALALLYAVTSWGPYVGVLAWVFLLATWTRVVWLGENALRWLVGLDMEPWA